MTSPPINLWTKLLTKANNTSNCWGSDPGIAPGVYYYLFQLADGTRTKGWMEVVK